MPPKDSDPLEAIASAMDNSEGTRDLSAARALADAYVAANADQFTELASKTLDECVVAVDVFRSAGMTAEQWKVETWLLHQWEPQNIGGVAAPTVRIPGNG